MVRAASTIRAGQRPLQTIREIPRLGPVRRLIGSLLQLRDAPRFVNRGFRMITRWPRCSSRPGRSAMLQDLGELEVVRQRGLLDGYGSGLSAVDGQASQTRPRSQQPAVLST
jgi:hypothetical protein